MWSIADISHSRLTVVWYIHVGVAELQQAEKSIVTKLNIDLYIYILMYV